MNKQRSLGVVIRPRRAHLCATFVLLFMASWAALLGCEESQNSETDAGGASGARASGGASGAGTFGGAGGDGGPAGEYIDEVGICRRKLTPDLFGCPDTYDAALSAPNPCGVACAGPAGSQLLSFRDCTPTVRCAYDSQTRGLVGAYWGDDVASHCEDSFSVVAGDFPAEPVFNGFDQDLACVPPAESSVAPLFNQLFGPNDPIHEGAACRAGHDQCHGSVRALVCLNGAGQVVGDGTCGHCSSDQQCQREYPYAAAETTCGPAGLCRFGSELLGACAGLSSACFTASAAYVCREGLCAECSSDDECSASGPYNLCLDGVCLRSFEP